MWAAGFGARALQDTLAASCAMLLCLALWTMPERCSRTPAPLLVEDTSPAEESPCPSAALSCHCAGQDPPPTPKRPHINPVSPILATRLEDLGLINAAREATAGRHVDLAGTSTSGGRCFAGPDMLERLPPGPIWTQSPAQLNHTMSGVPLAACTEQPAHQIPHDETSHEPDDSAGSSPASGSDSGQSSEEDGAPDTPPTSGVGSSARQAVSRGKLLGKARWQHILLMAAAGTLLVLSICAPPSASHNPPYQVQWESLHQHAGCLPTAPGLSASRARGSAPEGWGPLLDSESGAALTWGHLLAFKRTEAAGAAEGLNEGDSGWTSDRQPPSGACSIRQSYRAVWTSSALRAAANASLSTGGMHLMLAGLPHSFTVGAHSAHRLDLWPMCRVDSQPHCSCRASSSTAGRCERCVCMQRTTACESFLISMIDAGLPVSSHCRQREQQSHQASRGAASIYQRFLGMLQALCCDQTRPPAKLCSLVVWLSENSLTSLLQDLLQVVCSLLPHIICITSASTARYWTIGQPHMLRSAEQKH